MFFSHFHEIIFWDEHIGSISHIHCERMWFLQWQYYINLILIFLLPTNHDFGRSKQHLFDILIFTGLCQRIDNCFYSFGNAGKTPKFEDFDIAHQPTPIR